MAPHSSLRRAEQRGTLLDWGTLPHLAAAGSAPVLLATTRRLAVWSLTISGKRAVRIPATLKDGRLDFSVAIAGTDAHLYYELTASRGR